MKDVELTGRQKLIYEAFQKIHTGERMYREGVIELNNLIPPDKTKAHKTLHSNSGFSKSKLSDDKVAIDRILTMIDKEDIRVTAFYVHKQLNLSENRVRRLAEKMKQRGLIVEIDSGKGSGSAKIWKRVQSKSNSKSVNYISPVMHSDRVLTELKTNGPKTINALAEKLKINWTLTKRTIDHLVSLNVVTPTEKIGGHGNLCTFWEAV